MSDLRPLRNRTPRPLPRQLPFICRVLQRPEELEPFFFEVELAASGDFMARDRNLFRASASSAAALAALLCLSSEPSWAGDDPAHALAQRFSGDGEAPRQAEEEASGGPHRRGSQGQHRSKEGSASRHREQGQGSRCGGGRSQSRGDPTCSSAPASRRRSAAKPHARLPSRRKPRIAVARPRRPHARPRTERVAAERPAPAKMPRKRGRSGSQKKSALPTRGASPKKNAPWTERQAAEERRLAQEKREAEERRLAEEKHADEKRVAEEQRMAEEKLAEERREGRGAAYCCRWENAWQKKNVWQTKPIKKKKCADFSYVLLSTVMRTRCPSPWGRSRSASPCRPRCRGSAPSPAAAGR